MQKGKSSLQFTLLIVSLFTELTSARGECQPVAVATWHFGKIAVTAAADILRNGNAVDAVEAGVNAVELDTQDQYFVGYGGLPNADGVMELDAAIMDGNWAPHLSHVYPRSIRWRSNPRTLLSHPLDHRIRPPASRSAQHGRPAASVPQSRRAPAPARRAGLPVRRGARAAGLPPARVHRPVPHSYHHMTCNYYIS
jgi:hypothetical protein